MRARSTRTDARIPLWGARVPKSPVVPLPDTPIEYPPPEEVPETTPEEEEQQEPVLPETPVPVPTPEPEPAIPTGGLRTIGAIPNPRAPIP
jgi:hypothetical protein